MLSLRNKTYLALLVATALFLAATYTAVWRMTDSELHELQRNHVGEQLALVERLLNQEINALNTRQADWAHWDDTYQFITDRNSDYITSNLNDESLELIGVDIMAFVNNSGELVYGKQVYKDAPGENVIPDKFRSYFQGGSELLKSSESIVGKYGILTVSDTMLLISVQPIVMSDGGGSPRGTLIFAQYIDADFLQRLSALSGLHVQMWTVGSKNDEHETVNLSSTSRTMVEHGDGKAKGLRLLDNVFENPSLLLQIEYPSTIIDQGKDFLLRGLWYSLIALVSYVSVLIILIDYFLLRRIENMRRIVRQVGVLQAGGLPEGDIEDFSYLATIMMGALKNIQKSNDSAAGSRGELEKFQVALDQSFDHMIITDAEGKILHANSVAEELTGFSRKEMIGQTPGLWGRQMSTDFYRDFWDTIRLHKRAFNGEIVNKNKNGVRYRAQIRVTPILDDQKRVLYFIGVERFLGKA